jgi:hypothetical protein
LRYRFFRKISVFLKNIDGGPRGLPITQKKFVKNFIDASIFNVRPSSIGDISGVERRCVNRTLFRLKRGASLVVRLVVAFFVSSAASVFRASGSSRKFARSVERREL